MGEDWLGRLRRDHGGTLGCAAFSVLFGVLSCSGEFWDSPAVLAAFLAFVAYAARLVAVEVNP